MHGVAFHTLTDGFAVVFFTQGSVLFSNLADCDGYLQCRDDVPGNHQDGQTNI